MFGAPHIPQVPVASPADARRMVESGALLIDVREQEEWNEARIPGAEFRPLSTIRTWWTELPRDRTVVVYCRTGNRSAHVVEALRDQGGFDDIHNLDGGIVGWDEAGYEIER